MNELSKFAKAVVIDSRAENVWTALTRPEQMIKWMGEPEMNLEVHTSWEVGTSIVIRGFHHVAFDNKGSVLIFEPGIKLKYTHLSSVSRLPDVDENYSTLEFILEPLEEKTRLTLNIENFSTESIQKHLEFYWRTTILAMKGYIENLKED